MTRTRVILHIGLPKCASSALQNYFWDHRDWLAEQDVVYPAPVARTTAPKHQNLVSGLLSDGIDFSEFSWPSDPNASVVLSAEGLTNHLYDFSAMSLRKAAAHLEQFETFGLMIRRPVLTWLKSYYAQCAINPPLPQHPTYATNLRFEEFRMLARIQQLSNHDQVASDAKAAYGLSSITCVEFSESLLDDISAQLGIPTPPNSRLARANCSPATFVIEMVRQINGVAATTSIRKDWLGLVQGWADTGNTLLRSYWGGMKPERLKELDLTILDMLTESNHEEFSLKTEQIESFKDWVQHLDHSRWGNSIQT